MILNKPGMHDYVTIYFNDIIGAGILHGLIQDKRLPEPMVLMPGMFDGDVAG